MLNKNEFLLLEDFSDYNRFPKFQPINDWLHVNERFSIIIDHRNNTSSKANRTLGFLRQNLFSCPKEVKEAAYKSMVRPILEYGSTVWDPHCNGLNEELENLQKRAARFVTKNYSYETGSMSGILEELKWETLQKRRKHKRLILLYKGLKGKARFPTDDLIPKNSHAEINTHWSFRFQLLVKMPTRKVSFPKLSGTGLSSLILSSQNSLVVKRQNDNTSSPLLNCRTIVYLNLLPL